MKSFMNLLPKVSISHVLSQIYQPVPESRIDVLNVEIAEETCENKKKWAEEEIGLEGPEIVWRDLTVRDDALTVEKLPANRRILGNGGN
jgi:hypothetical protein